MSLIKVLVVDDSPIFREFLIRSLANDNRISVVGAAGDPYEARDMIVRLKPDVMTCDIEMPKMNGIEFVTKLIPQYPLPVVMISSLSDKVFEAMNAGAVDFVVKPAGSKPADISDFAKNQLIPAVIGASKAKIRIPEKIQSGREYGVGKAREDIVIAIGASTGGTEAITSVVSCFGRDIPGIVITQHIQPKFSEMFAERLGRQTRLICKEAESGDIVKPGHLYVAPGDRQMRLINTGKGYQLECKGTEKVNGHCPSVDVLFDSVAQAAGKKAIGILLTGMGADGAKGLLNMKNAGALTIGQDRNTCVVYGMPMEAYKLGAVSFQLPLKDIPKKVDNLLQRY